MMAPWLRLPCVIAALLLFAAPAFAYRREYVATVDGQRKAGSQVCFYGGKSVADAFALFFTYQRVGCLPADDVLDLPPGLFHAFARHADGFVSGHPDYFVYTGPAAPEAGYQRLEIPMEPAASIDVSGVVSRLSRGQSVGVWLAPTEMTGGTFFPLVEGENSILVPAGRPFLPLLIANGAPIAAGRPMTLRAGQREKLPAFSTSTDRTDVIAWVKVDRASAENIAEPLSPAEITLSVADAKLNPVFPLTRGKDATHSLLIFKDVPAGPAELQVRGKTWVHADIELAASTAPATLVRAPIILIPGAAVELRWNLDATWPGESECAAVQNGGSAITATLDECTAIDGTIRCEPIAKRSATFTPSGSLLLEGVPAGKYTVTLTPPFANEVVVETDLVAGEQKIVQASFSPFRFFGTVRVNGSPVQALLRFESGQAYADATGRYSAALAADPLGNAIEVVLCSTGEALRYFPHKQIAENSSYDIDVRHRNLTVTVTDSRGKRVSGAAVTFAPVRNVDQNGSAAIYYTSDGAQTGADGIAELTGIPADKPLVVCATHEAYPRTCTAPRRPDDLTSGALTVILTAPQLRGRVIDHQGIALLAWVNPAGSVTEQVTLSADGAFTLQHPHSPGEHLVYVSATRALTVLTSPQTGDDQRDVVISLPNAPVRSFTVTAPRMTASSGFIGIWVGGRYIPFDLLLYHHDVRHRDPMLTRGRATQIVDIAETGPISVAYVPEQAVVGVFVDPFTRPENTGIRRQAATSAVVELPEP
ncbi:MAG TPA: hypothetical protein VEK11_10580 [Thermoanaerobaculia bacterium]|nr:hypothetical protein [Thermoanaerobaculia bacterium]